MTEFLQNLTDTCNIPLFTAFLLGLLTAISPCPLATNITAVGYIGRNIESRRRVFLNGLLYALGRIVAYSALGALLIYLLRSGADLFSVQKSVSQWGEKLMAPLLILIGLFMLWGNRLNLPKFGFSGNAGTERLKGAWGSLLLGVLFAMAFCPTSGMLYFGMLIPMSAQASGGYFMPVAFAFATGLPVVVVAWILAFSMAGVGKFYNKMQVLQKWLNRVVAVLFIIVGLYYGYLFYLS